MNAMEIQHETIYYIVGNLLLTLYISPVQHKKKLVMQGARWLLNVQLRSRVVFDIQRFCMEWKPIGPPNIKEHAIILKGNVQVSVVRFGEMLLRSSL